MTDTEAEGVVKFWKAEQGWGAISSRVLPSGQDAFAHFSAVESDGYRELDEGQRVPVGYPTFATPRQLFPTRRSQ